MSGDGLSAMWRPAGGVRGPYENAPVSSHAHGQPQGADDSSVNRRMSQLEASNSAIAKEIQLHGAKLSALEQDVAIFYAKIATIEAKRKKNL